MTDVSIGEPPVVAILDYIDKRLCKVSDAVSAVSLIASEATLLLDKNDEGEQAGALRSVTFSLEERLAELKRDVAAMLKNPDQRRLCAALGQG